MNIRYNYRHSFSSLFSTTLIVTLCFFKDFIITGCGVQMSDKTSTWCTKALAVGYGILSYLVVYLVKYLPGVLEVCSI